MKLSFSVIITTRFGTPIIVKTIKSLKASLHVKNFPIIVVNGGGNFSPNTKQELSKLKVKTIEIKNQGSILEKVKIGVKNTNTDIIILTQDDIVFSNTTLKEIMDNFESDKSLTMICTKPRPKEQKGFLQKTLVCGMNIVQEIATNYRSGDNYLSANGRCMAFKRTFVQNFRLPIIVNVDAFLYFENKLRGGNYKYLKDSKVYLGVPKNLQDHLKQSKRFQGSFDELSKIFGKKIKKEYEIPQTIKIKALLKEFVDRPLYLLSYLLITMYTRLWTTKETKSEAHNATWAVDVSTK
jgi:cellulose synthase/poly-beta-1,6-N-acetylglucosamine synthase-like glycosyltransferase